MLITGGGRHNYTLMRMIPYYCAALQQASAEGAAAEALACKFADGEIMPSPPLALSMAPQPRAIADLEVSPVERVGWNGDMLEAEAFAYLAARSAQGLALSLPETTGVAAPVSGGVLFAPAAHSDAHD